MPAPVTFVRATLTDSDTLNAAAFNALTAPSATVPDAAPGTAGVMPATTTLAGLALINALDAAAQRIALGLGSLALQAANTVAIIGGAINGTPIGATTPSTVAATTISASGNLTLSATNSNILGGTSTGSSSIFNSTGASGITVYGPTHATKANQIDVFAGGLWHTFNSAGLAVTGALSATGNASITGAVSSANAFVSTGVVTANGADRVTLDFGSGTFGRVLAWGPNNSTAGQLDLGVLSANASVGSTSIARITSTGLAVTGALSATGNGTFGGGGVSGTLLASNAGVDTTAYTAGSYNANHRLWLGTGNATNAYAAIRFSGSGGVHEGLFGTVQNASGNAEFFWNLYSGSSYVERLRLSATGLAVTGQFGNSFTGANGQYALSSDNTSSANFHVFYNSASVAIGSINRVTTTNAVSYNTTSDRRIKENFGLLTDSGRLIDLLTPRTFDRKDGSDTDRKGWLGFVAQEVHAADPVFARIGFVTVGDDDPTEVTKTWGVSSSPIDALLVAEIQSLRARVAHLEAA